MVRDFLVESRLLNPKQVEIRCFRKLRDGHQDVPITHTFVLDFTEHFGQLRAARLKHSACSLFGLLPESMLRLPNVT